MKQMVLFLVLTGLVGSMLFYQWRGYSSELENELPETEQQIRIHHRDGIFEIEQTITKMKNQQYQLKIPNQVNGVECINLDGSTCLKDETSIDVINDEVTLTYSIEAPTNPKSFLLQNWLIDLGIPIHGSKVQLNEYTWRNGKWISGDETQTKIKKDLIDYYYFSFPHNVSALYWQAGDLVKTNVNEDLIIYSDANLTNADEMDRFLSFNDKKKFVILTEQHEERIAEPFIILDKSQNRNELIKKLFIFELKQSFKIEENEEWLLPIVASIYSNEPPHDEKSKKMVSELQKILTEEQMEEWKQEIRYLKQLDSKSLDDLLGEIIGFKLKFFEINANSDSFTPFLIFDDREIFVKGVLNDEIDIYYDNDRALIKLIPLLEQLQYEVNVVDQNKIIANKGEIHYQFYPDRRYFELNKRRYGTTKPPIIWKNQTLYIELPLIQTFFNVEITESLNKIEIK